MWLFHWKYMLHIWMHWVWVNYLISWKVVCNHPNKETEYEPIMEWTAMTLQHPALISIFCSQNTIITTTFHTSWLQKFWLGNGSHRITTSSPYPGLFPSWQILFVILFKPLFRPSLNAACLKSWNWKSETEKPCHDTICVETKPAIEYFY